MITITKKLIAAIFAAGVLIGTAGMYASTKLSRHTTPEDCILSHVKRGMNSITVTELSEACRSRYAPLIPSWGANDLPVPTRPASLTDSKAWNAYLGQLVQNNLQGMKASQAYSYLVTDGITSDDKVQNDRQLQSVEDTLARGVLPGNLLAFAGPSSNTTVDLMLSAFKGVKPGSLKGVIILFIGDNVDESWASIAVQPSGAELRFVQM